MATEPYWKMAIFARREIRIVAKRRFIGELLPRFEVGSDEGRITTGHASAYVYVTSFFRYVTLESRVLSLMA